jgi:tripartite-type tricarboxylate transporter receptor subunit TctC
MKGGGLARAACTVSSRRGRRRLLGGLLLSMLGTRAGAADEPEAGPWPPRRIRIIVAYPVGGISSEVARALGEALAQQLAVPVTVEHRPGAGGTLAIDAIARARGDTGVLAFSAVTPLTLAPLLGSVPYDPARDVAPVMGVMRTPVLIVGTPALPAADMASMLAWARAGPDGVRWASSGIGTTGHMVLERFAQAAGIRVTHIPYAGGGQQLSDALGGQFELLSTNVAPAQLRHVRQGRLTPLAVTGPARLPSLPKVPTLGELGMAQASLVSTFGLFAPGGLSAAALGRINAALAAALADSGLAAALAAADNIVLGGSAAAFERLIAEDREAHRRWFDDRR